MKKLFLSAIAAAALFSACSSDDAVVDNVTPGETGSIKTQVYFETVSGGASTKAAGSSYVPATSWADIKDLKAFLYYTSGAAAGQIAGVKDIPVPTSGSASLTWNSIAVGTYDLVIVANSSQTGNASIDAKNIAPYINNTVAQNLTGATTNSINGTTPSVYLGLFDNTAAAPSKWNDAMVTASKAYQQPNEVFASTAPTSVTIASGATTTPSAISIRREVSLLRVRIDHTSDLDDVGTKNPNAVIDFNAEVAGIPNVLMLVKQPKVGYAFSYSPDAFEGGLPDNSVFDISRAVLAASGTGIYGTAGSPNASAILDGNFTYFKDIVVFPNVSKKEACTKASITMTELFDNSSATAAKLDPILAEKDNQYWIIISGKAPAGTKVKKKDGSIYVLTADATVYFGGTIKNAMITNCIREVNLKVVGIPIDTPPDPVETGDLDITVSAPLQWNPNILEETLPMQ